MNEPQSSAPLDPRDALPPEVAHELSALRHDWWWFMVLGLGLVLLGSLAIGSAYLVSIVTVVFFGLLMLIGGIALLVSSFWAGHWSGFLVHLLIGLLYVVTGLFVIDVPKESAEFLTLLLAMMFFIGGLFRIVASLRLRFPMWGWSLLNGVISLLLGVLIYKQWPASGDWVIGLFVGIELIFNGWVWVMMSLALRALPGKK